MPLAELHGAAAVNALGAAIDRADDAATRLAVLSDSVGAQIARRDGRRDARVERCVERLQKSDGRVALAELSVLAGLGERQLQRRFAESRRHRAAHARRRDPAAPRLRRAARGALVDVVRAAQAAGYFDHPPMARDFHHLLGQPPSQWAGTGLGPGGEPRRRHTPDVS